MPRITIEMLESLARTALSAATDESLNEAMDGLRTWALLGISDIANIGVNNRLGQENSAVAEGRGRVCPVGTVQTLNKGGNTMSKFDEPFTLKPCAVDRERLLDEISTLNPSKTRDEWRKSSAYKSAVRRRRFPAGSGIEDVKSMRYRSQHFVFTALSAEDAKTVVRASTQGRAELVVDGDYGTLVPRNPIDREAYASFSQAYVAVMRHWEGEDLFTVYEIDRAVTWYMDYLFLNRRDYVRRVFKQQMMPKGPDSRPSTSGQFEGFLYGIHRRLQRGGSLSGIEILPHGTPSSRRWGIEVEAVDIAGIDTPPGWDKVHDGSLEPVYDEARLSDHDDDCSYWDEDEEGNRDYDCDCGYSDQDSYDFETETGEYNSPILHSFHSRGLESLCGALQVREVNSTPGIHVHVEADDLSPAQAAKVALLYTAFEPLFGAEYNREDRSYCKSLEYDELLECLASAKEKQREHRRAVDASLSIRSRYRTVNLEALYAHGTIEFRAMGPVYNYEHLIRWACLCREFVNLARADVPQKEWIKVAAFEDLILLMSKYGKETPTPSWAPITAVQTLNEVAALPVMEEV